jgi:hypothetical protein
MKFTILDSSFTQSNHHEDKTYRDKYRYLDDLLDKTFITDYFMVHADDNDDKPPSSNK